MKFTLFKDKKDRRYVVMIIIIMLFLKILGILFVSYYVKMGNTDKGIVHSSPEVLQQAKLPAVINALGYRWDCIHYVNISLLWKEHFKRVEQLSNYAYMYPVIIMVTAWVVRSSIVAALLVSNLFSFLAVIALYFLCRLYLSHEKSFAAAVALIVYPSFFVTGLVAYSEPMFIFFAIMSWYFYEQEDYILSSLFVVFTLYTRTSGVILIPIYLLTFMYDALKKSREEKRLVLPNPECLWYLVPIAFFISQNYITRSIVLTCKGNGSESFSGILPSADSRFYPVASPLQQFKFFLGCIGHGLDMYSHILPFLLLGIYLKKFNTGLVIYVVIAVISVLSISKGGIIRAIPRHILNAWPAFIAMGEFLENRYFLLVYAVTFALLCFKTLDYYFLVCYI